MVSVFLKEVVFIIFPEKTIALIRFHLLVLTINQESVFPRPDDLIGPHSLLSTGSFLIYER